MARTLTQAEYQDVLNSGADFCDCCGGKYTIGGLVEASMPDESGNLQSGYAVCQPCQPHAEAGACQPEKCVSVQV